MAEVRDFYIHKPDLDTCLTALILGIVPGDRLTVLPGTPAPSELLADPGAVCIEVGGSGQVELNNFDHHDGERYFSPACRQACRVRYGGQSPAGLARLVDYVVQIDDPPAGPVPNDAKSVEFPSLSNLFSGMLMVTSEPEAQFRRGVGLLAEVLAAGCDPFAPLPERPEWESFLAAKRENQQRLEEGGILERTVFFTAASGLRVGFLDLTAAGSDLIVGPGSLYSHGCEIAVVFSPAFSRPPVWKFTIAGRERPVNHLLPHLNRLEPGWGGRERIIGSPQERGSRLTVEQVIAAVKNYV